MNLSLGALFHCSNLSHQTSTLSVTNAMSESDEGPDDMLVSDVFPATCGERALLNSLRKLSWLCMNALTRFFRFFAYIAVAISCFYRRRFAFRFSYLACMIMYNTPIQARNQHMIAPIARSPPRDRKQPFSLHSLVSKNKKDKL